MKYIYIFLLWICGTTTLVKAQKIAGVVLSEEGASDELMLFAPLASKTTYLVDGCGRVVNSWLSEYTAANTVYLFPNGNIVRTTRLNNEVITGGGGGGGLEILDWNSNRLWSYTINSETQRLHHDITLLPNGNILAIVWELKPEQECLDQGRNPNRLSNKVIWSERIVEIKPVFPDGAEIVWEWSIWDHLIQDYDPSKANYGVVEDHPELVDINFTQSPAGVNDWLHINSVDYNEELDQIVLSTPFLNEFWIIDHSTTREEAAGHEGGNSGKGGDLLYRWGNPAAYKKGDVNDKRLFGQHHVHWVNDGLPRAGSIMIFNNQPGSNFSSVDFIEPPVNDQGEYQIENGRFGPIDQDYIYKQSPPELLYSPIMGGAEVLSNGNLLICSSIQGKIFEVTTTDQIVWEYKSPVTLSGIVGRDLPSDEPFTSDRNFRATKYPLDFAGFVGKNLAPGEPIEGEPWPECAIPLAAESSLEKVTLFPNPADDKLYIKHYDESAKLSVKLLTSQGKELRYATGTGEIILDISNVSSGVLIAVVNNSPYKIIKVK